MANPDHLSMLREGGVREWNGWRLAHPGVVPNLFNAEPSKADLAGDDATGANLYRANLEGANLIGTNLHGVNLREANLTSARLGFTLFGNSNLSFAGGLDDCQHFGPSVVDYQTLAKSWPLSLVFLRGCGLPETLIEYLPALLSKPGMTALPRPPGVVLLVYGQATRQAAQAAGSRSPGPWSNS